MRKNTLLLGLVAYGGLLLMALVFYKERIINIDASYQLFCLLEGNSLWTTDRFGSAITHIFPFLGAKLGLPLESLVVAYSASFTIVYFASFLVLLFVFKNPKFALVQLLFNTLMVTHSFYWAQCELVQGVAYSLIFLAAVERVLHEEKTPPWFFLLAPILLTIIIFIYPLLPFVLFFVLAFWALHYQKKWRFLCIVAACYLVGYLLKQVLFKTSYDQSAMSGLKHIFTLFPNYFTIPSNSHFIKYCVDHYYFLPLLLAAAIVFYIVKKQYQKLGLLLFFFFGYLFIVNISIPNGSQQFYIENQYLILTIFVAFPLLYDVLPALKRPLVDAILLWTIVLLGLIRIYNLNDKYSDRLNWYRQKLAETAQMPTQKWIIPSGKVPMDKLMFAWASAYEFWLLSTIEGGVSRSVIIEEVPGEFDWAIPQNKAMIAKWGTFPYEKLNPRYFMFSDTSYYQKY